MKNKEMSIEDYLKDLYNNGYIEQDGEPIKCLKCGSKKLEDCNYINECFGTVEYQKRCKCCGEIAGVWAYGYWQWNEY